MMTSGPRARVGDIVPVPFERPRTRGTVLEDARYYPLRERLIGFLESQDHHATPRRDGAHAAPSAAAPALAEP
jgi:hypothetical protein